jgi:hypothetical protein
MFCDAKTMTVEELVGRLRAAEERLEDKVEQIVDKAGRLLLTEEDWLEKHKHRFQQGPKDGGSGSSGGKFGGDVAAMAAVVVTKRARRWHAQTTTAVRK